MLVAMIENKESFILPIESFILPIDNPAAKLQAENREQSLERERLAPDEYERQTALWHHAADIATLYTDKTEVFEWTGKTRDDYDEVYYRSTSPLLNPAYSDDKTDAYLFLENEGYKKDSGRFSILYVTTVDKQSGREATKPLVHIGDADARLDSDDIDKPVISGVTLNGGQMVNDPLSQKEKPVLIKSTSKEFKAVKDILDWMTVAYADQASTTPAA